jgi:branched-chain amino acid transport system substrate-binding protein
LSKEKISRRSFTKTAAGTIVGLAVGAGIGYGASSMMKPPGAPGATTTVTKTVTGTATPTSTPGKRKVVKVGTTKPLSGIESILGRNEWEGVQVWADWVREQGGIKGGDGNIYDVEVVFYDDENKPDNVARLFEKLITEDKCDYLLGPLYGPLGMAAVPVVMRYGKLDFYGTCSYVPDDWEKEYGEYVLHTITNGPHYIEGYIDMVMDYVIPELGDKEADSFALIHGDDIFRYSLGQGTKSYLEKRGCNLVHYEQYSTDLASVDLSPILTKVKAANPKCLIVGGGYPDAVLTVKQCADLGLDVNLMFPGTGTVTHEWYEAVSPYGEGCLATTQWEPGVIWPANYGPSHDWLVNYYNNKFGREPDYCAGTGFQQALAMQHAMENCDQPLDTGAMREYIRKSGNEFTSFYGKYLVDENGIQTGHKMSLMQWQNKRKMCVWLPEVANTTLMYPMKTWKEKETA